MTSPRHPSVPSQPTPSFPFLYNREFDLALDDPLNKGMHVLRVRIRDIMTGPDPAVIAEEEVDLTKQGIEANGAKQHVWVPLTKLSHLDELSLANDYGGNQLSFCTTEGRGLRLITCK